MLILALLAGCHKDDDPRLTAVSDALQAYDAGIVKMNAKDPKGALADFQRARKADPDAVPLALWEAKAQADAGDVEAAVYVLDGLLTEHQGASQAWYNRAAYKARLGDSSGAAADLQIALRAGVTTPHGAAADPDFAALAGGPGGAGLLPEAAVTITAAGPEGSVFLGSNVELTLTLVGVPSPAPALSTVSPDPGCLRLTTILEDDHAAGADLVRVLTLRFTPVGPCVVSLGPFAVTTAGRTSTSPPVRVEVDAPPGTLAGPPAPPLPSALPLPSGLTAGAAEPTVTPTADGFAAMAGPDHPLEGRTPDVRLEWRVDGQTRSVGGWWKGGAPLTLTSGDWTRTLP